MSTPIFNYQNDDYNELKYNLFSINKEWENKTSITTNMEKFGIDEDSYAIDVKKGIFSPEDFCKNIDECIGAIITLYNTDDGSENINKELLIKQLAGLVDYYTKLYDLTTQNGGNNYTNYLVYNIANYAILNHTYRPDIRNKYMCFGPGNKIEQIVPKYIIDDIKDNGEKYEIFIFENCGDKFGCPSGKFIYDHLVEKMTPEQISNLKIYHIKNFIEVLSFWHILQNIYIEGTQIILCDTIWTCHVLKSEIDGYNNKLSIINTLTDNKFKNNFLIPKKIISYQCTGNKIIFFSQEADKFVGHGTKNDFLLKDLSYDVIKNNAIPKDLDLNSSGKSYYIKYIKYKNKYIKLKTTLAKQ